MISSSNKPSSKNTILVTDNYSYMRKFNYLAALIAFLILSIHGLNAQSIAKKYTSKDTSSKPVFTLQLDYLNNYLYNGRADSIASPYQITTASVNFGNGIYSNLIANYLLTPNEKRFDFFEFDLGYEYKLGKKISGEIYGSKYFYSNQSSLLNGDITSDIGATLNYDLGFFQFNNTLDLFFSGKSDFQYMAGIEKSFEFGQSNSKWDISPSIYSVFSTLNYYESVFTRKLNAQKGIKNTPAPTANIQSVTTLLDKGFKLLDMECSLPISYQTGAWSIVFTPTLAIPYHSIHTVTVNSTTLPNGSVNSNTIDSTPYSEKNLRNRFFFQLGVNYKF